MSLGFELDERAPCAFEGLGGGLEGTRSLLSRIISVSG